MPDAVLAEVLLPSPLRHATRALRAARPLRAAVALVIPMLALAGCSQSDDAAAATGRAGSGPRAPSVIAPPRSSYRPAAVANGGSVRGVVELDGVAPRDTTVQPTRDEEVCGVSLTDRTTDRNGDRLGGVVVWLADVRSGKVLPRARRFELTNERCQITPRVQAAIVGGTLNVRNADATQHRTRFLRQEDGHVLALVSQTDAGQVVPVERVLVAQGLVEVRNDQHPWMRGWIAVFDHPYFGVTERDGAFTFDSVPPGTYRLMAWHERLGKVEQRVTIAAGKDSRVVMKLRKGDE